MSQQQIAYIVILGGGAVQIVEVSASGGCVAGGASDLARVSDQQVSAGGLAGGSPDFVRVLVAQTPQDGAIAGGEPAYVRIIDFIPSEGAIVGGGDPDHIRIVDVISALGAIAGGSPDLIKIQGFDFSGGAIAGGNPFASYYIQGVFTPLYYSDPSMLNDFMESEAESKSAGHFFTATPLGAFPNNPDEPKTQAREFEQDKIW